MPSSLMLRRTTITSIMVWSAIEEIDTLFIIVRGTKFNIILIIIVTILISFKTLLEVLDLPSHLIHFKSMDVPLEFLHMTPVNNYSCKSKALISI
jgi:hypothetical protein